jgi:hypothetical protein
MDRWWIGALMHSEPKLESFLASHFASFRTPGIFPTLKSSIPSVLHYPDIVREVLSAPWIEQEAFVKFLSVFGSGKMLIPFISNGSDTRDKFIGRGFLRAAVIGRNHDTYDTFFMPYSRLED